MARSLNRAMIIGNLGQDPSLKHMPNGDAVCNLSVATTTTWKDKDSGERKESVEWHSVVFYKRMAEVAEQYLVKGSQVFIEGRLRTRKWHDEKKGVDRYTTEIIGEQLQMLGGKKGATGAGGAGSPPADDGYDDDLPF